MKPTSAVKNMNEPKAKGRFMRGSVEWNVPVLSCQTNFLRRHQRTQLLAPGFMRPPRPLRREVPAATTSIIRPDLITLRQWSHESSYPHGSIVPHPPPHCVKRAS